MSGFDEAPDRADSWKRGGGRCCGVVFDSDISYDRHLKTFHPERAKAIGISVKTEER